MDKTFVGHVIRVIDGDTFEILAELGFGIEQKLVIRLFGVNTPEIRGASKLEGLKSKEVVKNLIEGKEVTLVDKGREKYGRSLALVYFKDKNLSEYLIESNLGLSMQSLTETAFSIEII